MNLKPIESRPRANSISSPPTDETRTEKKRTFSVGGSPIGVVSYGARFGSPSGSNDGLETEHKTLYIKVKFPPDYPSEFKVVCLDPECSVSQAIKAIQSAYKLPRIPTFGLYSQELKNWLSEKHSLKDIDILKTEETVIEYRDKKNPVNLGDLRARRRTQSLHKKTGSPFFQQWEDQFKHILKKTEEKEKRENTLLKVFTEEEMIDIGKKLKKLAEPRNGSSKKEALRKSVSMGVVDGIVIEDDMEDKLKQRDEDTQMAAEIGNALLAQNSHLLQQIKELQEKEKELQKLKQSFSELESETVRLTSRCMFLENQSEEGKEINKALIQEITQMSSEDSSKIKIKSFLKHGNSQNPDDMKKELEESKQRELKLQKELDKFKRQNEELQEEMEQLKSRFTKDREIEEMKQKIDSLNKRLDKKLKKVTIQTPPSQEFTSENMIHKVEQLLENSASLKSTNSSHVLDNSGKLLDELKQTPGNAFSKLLEKIKNSKQGDEQPDHQEMMAALSLAEKSQNGWKEFQD